MSYTKRAMEDVIDDVSDALGCSYFELFDKVMETPEELTVAERAAIESHENGHLFIGCAL